MAEAALDIVTMKALLECAICLGQVKNHRALPCQHLFCQTCLEPLVKDGGIPCPVCRKVCLLEGKPLDCLPRSPLAVSLLETLCENCQSRKKTSKCPHCKQWVCSVCQDQCRKDLDGSLKCFKEESFELLSTEQHKLKLVHDKMFTTNKQVAEISDEINQHIEQAIAELRSQQTELQEALKKEGTKAMNHMNLIYGKVNDSITKLADFVRADTTQSAKDVSLSRQSGIYERWGKCLADVRERHSDEEDTITKARDARENPEIVKLCKAALSISDYVCGKHNPWTGPKSNTTCSLETAHKKDGTKHQLTEHAGTIKLQSNETNLGDDNPPLKTVPQTSTTGGTVPVLDQPVSQTVGDKTFAEPSASTRQPIPTLASDTSTTWNAVSAVQPWSTPAYDTSTTWNAVSAVQQWSTPAYDTSTTWNAVCVGPPPFPVPPRPLNYDRILSSPDIVYGSRGYGQDKFDCPSFIAVDPTTGNVVVSDNKNNRVVVLDRNLKFLNAIENTSLDISEHGYGGIAVDSNGYIVVADTGHARIQIINRRGNCIQCLGTYGDSPLGLVCDTMSWDIYVCDTENHRINVVKQNGEFCRIFGSEKKMGAWSPNGIALFPNGDIVVSDSGDEYDGALNIFHRNGKHISTLGTGQRGSVSLRTPGDVAVDREGNIIVTDAGTHLVHVLRCNGQLIKTFGGPGRGPGQFNYPAGVACTEDGGVIIVDQGNHRIQFFKNTQ